MTIRRLSLLALVLFASGCALSFDARSLGLPATMAAPAGQPVAGDSFAVTERAMHLFWGLYPARQPNLQNLLAGQMAGAGGVQNLRIRVRKHWPDVLLTVLTAGLVSTTAVTFEGVIAPRVP
jgi:hypothetical protein